MKTLLRFKGLLICFALGASAGVTGGVLIQQWLHPTVRIEQNVRKIKGSPGTSIDFQQKEALVDSSRRERRESRRERREREKRTKK